MDVFTFTSLTNQEFSVVASAGFPVFLALSWNALTGGFHLFITSVFMYLFIFTLQAAVFSSMQMLDMFSSLDC